MGELGEGALETYVRCGCLPEEVVDRIRNAKPERGVVLG